MTWLAAVVAVAGAGLIQVPQAAAETASVVTGPTFNNPTGEASEQNAILNHVADLIKGAVSGSSIRTSGAAADDSLAVNDVVVQTSANLTT